MAAAFGQIWIRISIPFIYYLLFIFLYLLWFVFNASSVIGLSVLHSLTHTQSSARRITRWIAFGALVRLSSRVAHTHSLFIMNEKQKKIVLWNKHVGHENMVENDACASSAFNISIKLQMDWVLEISCAIDSNWVHARCVHSTIFLDSSECVVSFSVWKSYNGLSGSADVSASDGHTIAATEFNRNRSSQFGWVSGI